MSTRSFFVIALCIIVIPISAQTLVMPRDITKAYKNETRSADGRPGKKYWQNTARYNISVNLTPPARLVIGQEQIVYVNNSPDTLAFLNMKLILNIHQAGAARFRGTDSSYITDGIIIDSTAINGVKDNWTKDDASSTNHKLNLKNALPPHDSVKIYVAWHYTLALGAGREGVIDPGTFYLAYFYPRVSVYDDYNGWDQLEFNDRQEFYNDFNDYTLKVTVPKNVVVWATGTLQNPEKVLQPAIVTRLKSSMLSDSILRIADSAGIAGGSVTTQNETNTWIWKSADISDVAIGISDHYSWDAASTEVDAKSHRRASMQAAYNEQSADFHHSVKFGLFALKWFSNNLPGVPYPFPKMTAFQGFADMEFPMMVNDSHIDDLKFAELLQDHEMVHTWFPFYMGINETRFGYMDEGWATTFEKFIDEKEVRKEEAMQNFKAFRISDWINDPAGAEDLPLITPTSELKDGYAHNAYGKASLSYLALKDLLGDDLFKKALHRYMSNWHGKHPVPWDYFNSISAAVGKNLNWFFYNWFYTYNYPDLAVAAVDQSGTGCRITIGNIGGFAIPFDLELTYDDGSTATIHETPEIWHENQKRATISLKKAKLSALRIDCGVFMDADQKNNAWHK